MIVGPIAAVERAILNTSLINIVLIFLFVYSELLQLFLIVSLIRLYKAYECF